MRHFYISWKDGGKINLVSSYYFCSGYFPHNPKHKFYSWIPSFFDWPNILWIPRTLFSGCLASKPMFYSHYSVLQFLRLHLAVSKWQEDREREKTGISQQNFLGHSSSDQREGFLYLVISGNCVVTVTTELQHPEWECPLGTD